MSKVSTRVINASVERLLQDRARLRALAEEWDRLAVSWAEVAREAQASLDRYETPEMKRAGREAPPQFYHEVEIALARKEIYENCAAQLRKELGL